MIAIVTGIIFAVCFVGVAAVFADRRPAIPALSLVLAAASFGIGVVAYPNVNVWQREMAGKAELRQADWNRQIRIREAEAESEAAKMLAQAEIERARGVAQANEIITDGLGGPEGYLRYLYIQAIDKASRKGSSQFVYLPTEAGLPMLEAGRITAKN